MDKGVVKLLNEYDLKDLEQPFMKHGLDSMEKLTFLGGSTMKNLCTHQLPFAGVLKDLTLHTQELESVLRKHCLDDEIPTSTDIPRTTMKVLATLKKGELQKMGFTEYEFQRHIMDILKDCQKSFHQGIWENLQGKLLKDLAKKTDAEVSNEIIKGTTYKVTNVCCVIDREIPKGMIPDYVWRSFVQYSGKDEHGLKSKSSHIRDELLQFYTAEESKEFTGTCGLFAISQDEFHTFCAGTIHSVQFPTDEDRDSEVQSSRKSLKNFFLDPYLQGETDRYVNFFRNMTMMEFKENDVIERMTFLE